MFSLRMGITIGQKTCWRVNNVNVNQKKVQSVGYKCVLHVLTAQKMYSIKNGRFIQLEAQIMHNTPRQWEYSDTSANE